MENVKYPAPLEGWSRPDRRGHITFVKHHARPWGGDRPPAAPPGYVYHFLGIHGVGPGTHGDGQQNFTRWCYRPMTEEELLRTENGEQRLSDDRQARSVAA